MRRAAIVVAVALAMLQPAVAVASTDPVPTEPSGAVATDAPAASEEQPASSEDQPDEDSDPGTESEDLAAEGVAPSAAEDDGADVTAAEDGGEGAAEDDATEEVEQPEVPADQPEPPSAAVLKWGVKQSFRNYLTSPIAQGSVTPADGATVEGNEFVFAQVASSAEADTGIGVTTYRGSVAFWGHHGELGFVFANPMIWVRSATEAVLYLDVVVQGEPINDGKPVPVATFVPGAPAAVPTEDDLHRWADRAATLTQDGVAAFNGFYAAGEQLDPITATVFTGGVTVTDPDVDPPKPPTQPKPPVTPSTPDQRSTVSRTGYLDWGIFNRFRNYVTGPIAKGTISTSGGATMGGSPFRFGQRGTTANLPDPAGQTSYGGSVRFFGHGGQLNQTLSDPAIRVSGSSGVLTAAINGRRVDFATLNLSGKRRDVGGGAVGYFGVPARLTGAGAALFARDGNVFPGYGAGMAVDPVSFVIGATGAAKGRVATIGTTVSSERTEIPLTPPATTGLEVTGQLVPGGAVEASAPGFEPGEEDITVVLYSEPIVLGVTTADQSGTATWRGSLPADLEPGEHTLTFQGSVDRGRQILVTAAEPTECQVRAASLQWGFKESFRSYISGSIADGGWEVSGGATYDTPHFNWTKATGSLTADGAGVVDFTGAVKFTGHHGALATTISDPSITLAGDQATLAFDVASVPREAAESGADAAVIRYPSTPFVAVDLSGAERDGDTFTVIDAPTTLTEAGNLAFDTYPAGQAFDPLTLSVTSDCDLTAADATAEQEPQEDVADSDSAFASFVKGMAWGAGAVLLLIGLYLGGQWLRRRRNQS